MYSAVLSLTDSFNPDLFPHPHNIFLTKLWFQRPIFILDWVLLFNIYWEEDKKIKRKKSDCHSKADRHWLFMWSICYKHDFSSHLRGVLFSYHIEQPIYQHIWNICNYLEPNDIEYKYITDRFKFIYTGRRKFIIQD